MKNTTFHSFDLRPELIQTIDKLNFKYPTEIQEKVIPVVLDGQSVIGQSHTGSGKTHAFLLPLFNQIETDRREVQFVITSPTRELAIQIHEEVKKIIQYADKTGKWNSKLLIGGTDKNKMAEKLKNPPHIIVGTPGRILDLVQSNKLSIYSAKSFVVDEADLMLDLGFIEEVDQLLVLTKKDIQLLVFSATIPERLSHFFKKYLENPKFIKVDNHISPENMEHRFIDLRHRKRADVIIELSKVFQPYLALIFANGKKEVDELAGRLAEAGLNVGILHGGLTPRERKRVLKEIQSLKYEYVVATDLASRGIDISGVSHVINAELPKEEEFYIHRVGRTARAGLEGTAISLYTEDDIALIEKLEQKGLNFIYTDINAGSFIEANPWNKRTLRQKKATNLDEEAWKHVRKVKKVKPGYKKKMKKQQESIKKKMAVKNKKRKR